MSILISIIVLSVIVFVHELGHFISAKIFKMPVSDFSIGMGPRLLTISTKETDYNIRALPLGGHVNIEGMEESDRNIKNGFNSKPAWQRFIVLIAGVFMNFVFAIFILCLAFKIDGRYEMDNETYIGTISKNSPNIELLKENDKILSIEGVTLEKWDDITLELNKIKDKNTANIQILRNEDKINVKANILYDETLKKNIMGIEPRYKHIEISYIESLKIALNNFAYIFKEIFKGFSLLFRGRVSSDEISGPIGIFNVIGEVSKLGFIPIALLTAVLSINIGVLNLIPLPALDGGRILFVILEMLKIKVSKRIEENIHRFGIILLFIFIFIVSINDILKIFR